MPSDTALAQLAVIATNDRATPSLVYRALLRSIRDGLMVPGAKLPNERELAQQLNTSRTAVRSALAMMERQVSHMVRLIDELLEVSRVTRGTIVLQREDVEFGTVLATALEASKPLMDANGHHVAVRLPDEPVVVSIK